MRKEKTLRMEQPIYEALAEISNKINVPIHSLVVFALLDYLKIYPHRA